MSFFFVTFFETQFFGFLSSPMSVRQREKRYARKMTVGRTMEGIMRYEEGGTGNEKKESTSSQSPNELDSLRSKSLVNRGMNVFKSLEASNSKNGRPIPSFSSRKRAHREEFLTIPFFTLLFPSGSQTISNPLVPFKKPGAKRTGFFFVFFFFLNVFFDYF